MFKTWKLVSSNILKLIWFSALASTSMVLIHKTQTAQTFASKDSVSQRRVISLIILNQELKRFTHVTPKMFLAIRLT